MSEALNRLMGGTGPVDIDAPRSLLSAFLVGVIAPEVFIVQPGFVQGMVEQLGFSEQDAGYVASAEMLGLAATTILMTFVAHRFNWRRVIFYSVIVMFAANALCTVKQDLGSFTVLRFVAGLGAGSLVSLGFAAVGLSRNPDRNFGLLIMWVLVYGAIGLLLMPSAYAATGMNGVLWFFAFFPLLAIPVLRHFPLTGENVSQVEADALNLRKPLRITALMAMLSYFLAQGVVWAYLFLIGLAGGLDEQQVANGLMLSQFAGILGALAAATAGSRFGRAKPLLLGIVGGALCLYFIVGEFSFLVFAVTVCVYNFFWNLVHPYLLAAMASFDRRGRVVVHAVAMQMIGLAIGPGLAASVISGGDFVTVNWLGAMLFLLSAALILPPVVQHARLTNRTSEEKDHAV